MSVINASDSSFKRDVLDSRLPVLVDFWAPWCGPCRMVAPIVDAVAIKLTDVMKIVKVNTDENPDTAALYQITGIPTLIIFKEGQEVDRFGRMSETALEAKCRASI